ncbi:MAG: sodium:solute symporter family protein [Pseudomonadota bacterium]
MTGGVSDTSFGAGGLAFIGLYLLLMVGLGWAACQRQAQNSLSGFYLAGRDLGALVLLLTLYATQYSGNNLLGFPGQAHRIGFLWVMSVGFMTSVVVAYLAFAPRLYQSSRRHAFVTPGDWIEHRFASPALSLLAAVLLLIVLINFLLAQLMAMGHVVAVLSGGLLPFWAGVIGLSLVVLLYETIGGMRAVAWTDCAQGVMLLLGIIGIMVAVLPDGESLGNGNLGNGNLGSGNLGSGNLGSGNLGSGNIGSEGIAAASLWIMEHQPAKAAVPSAGGVQAWFSTLLLVSLSAAVYPQAIQRIFAARSTRALRHSIGVMAFMPLVTTLPLFLVGILSLPVLAGLDGNEAGIAADQVMPQLLNHWAGQSLWLWFLANLVLLGVVAAIMSTADSVLLSLSSILSKDVLAKTWLRGASSVTLTTWGKRLSWLVMAALVAFALSPRISLWGLIELKLEVLIQVSPLFFLGVLWPGLTARGALIGMLAGFILAVSLSLTGHGKPFGWHAGLWGLALNLTLAWGISVLILRSSPTKVGGSAKEEK